MYKRREFLEVFKRGYLEYDAAGEDVSAGRLMAALW